MIAASSALSAIPASLRGPLLKEYQTIVQNFLEQRWLPSELSGGRFSEIVYTILDGHARGTYPPAPEKPGNFVEACRKLEKNRLCHVPHSFQITIPRMLPALYDVRNNRNVGHVSIAFRSRRRSSWSMPSPRLGFRRSGLETTA